MKRLLLILLVSLALGGCQHRIRPPATVAEPARVYVIDYGRHASLALPKGEGRLIEWSWGDWNWFARGRTDIGTGVQALFASPRSTLARRELSPAPVDLRTLVGASEIHPLTVERRLSDALLASLERRWQRGRAQALRHPDGRVFVPDPARYSLANNSAHELSRWLEALGVEVRGSALTARFRVEEPAPAPTPDDRLLPGQCRADRLGRLIGREANKQIVAEARRLSGANEIRLIGPGEPASADFLTDRLTLETDGKRIVWATCA